MIRVAVPESFPVTEKFREATLAFERYRGPRSISLPDFDNGLTRMVYEGVVHSFMPPKHCDHLVLAAVKLSFLHELHGALSSAVWPKLFGHSSTHIPHGCVVTIECDRTLLYLVEHSTYQLAGLNVSDLWSQLDRAHAELRDGFDTGYGFGSLAEAIAGPMYANFILLGGRMYMIGISPHYNKWKDER